MSTIKEKIGNLWLLLKAKAQAIKLPNLPKLPSVKLPNVSQYLPGMPTFLQPAYSKYSELDSYVSPLAKTLTYCIILVSLLSQSDVVYEYLAFIPQKYACI